MIEKISSVNSYYGSGKQVANAGKKASTLDSVEISLEAQKKVQQDKIELAKIKLSDNFQDGKIKQEVLDKIVSRIADEILGTSST